MVVRGNLRWVGRGFVWKQQRRRVSSSSSDGGSLPDSVRELVELHASKEPRRLSLKDLMETGSAPMAAEGGGRLARMLAGERVLMGYAGLLHEELPVRLAHRIQDLERVPGLSDTPSVRAVKGVYAASLTELANSPPPDSPSAEAAFGRLLGSLYEKHSGVLLTMARGAREFRTILEEHHGRPTDTFPREDSCHAFLDRFYSSRVGIRVLAGQYLALRDQLLPDESTRRPSPPGIVSWRRKPPPPQPPQHQPPPWAGGGSNNLSSLFDPAAPEPPHHHHDDEDLIGIVCRNTSPGAIVRAAAHDATRLCVARFGRAPEVVLEGNLGLAFPYIPSHLHYILLEILKNAMRATMEQHAVSSSSSLSSSPAAATGSLSLLSAPSPPQPHGNGAAIPPVTVVISDGDDNEDVVLKVSDLGGGIPRSRASRIWSYLYTTADPGVQEKVLGGGGGDHHHGADDEDAPILAGLGYGLPMSRAYARYFGGDLDLLSMEGYGTDAYIHLVRLGEKASLSI